MRDWNLYHKAVLALISAMILSVLIKALTAISGGGFVVEDVREIDVSADALWPWMIAADNRIRWEAELIDITARRGASAAKDATRWLFWETRGVRWNSREVTTDSVPGRRYSVYQDSDTDIRSMTLTLTPLTACRTRVRVETTIRPKMYRDRFWSLLLEMRAGDRLDRSMQALARWSQRLPDCGAASAKTHHSR